MTLLCMMYRTEFVLLIGEKVVGLSNDLKQFKMPLKGFLYFHSFYSLDEYFKYNMNYF
jgi:hypothetical protein